MTGTDGPAYRRLWASGVLAERTREARLRLADCDLCARYCRVDRLRGTTGAVCRTGERAVVASWGAHHGEEAPLSGWRGSGTIFFSWCNLRCLHCQNFEISWQGEGRDVAAPELAAMMLSLQRQGCHNINLVSPSHVVAQILEAVGIAAGEGLRLPLVYNTGGYDSLEALRLLDGVVDVYMPDLKHGDEGNARACAKVRDYVAVNRLAVAEMHRQVGDLVLDGDGLARRGLLVRHLVLPDRRADTDAVMRFLATEISPDTYLNIMDQYRPCYRAAEIPGLDRRPTAAEMREAFRLAADHGLRRLDARSPAGWPAGWRAGWPAGWP
ncbi:MAG: radical SAM protein [Rhodospirillales bacterium]